MPLQHAQVRRQPGAVGRRLWSMTIDTNSALYDNQIMTTSLTDFASLALPAHVLANLTQLGYTQMTPIQAASLPVALLGKDLIAQAKTGSGKTAAFGIALLAPIGPRGLRSFMPE